MKKIIISLTLLLVTIPSFSQEPTEEQKIVAEAVVYSCIDEFEGKISVYQLDTPYCATEKHTIVYYNYAFFRECLGVAAFYGYRFQKIPICTLIVPDDTYMPMLQAFIPLFDEYQIGLYYVILPTFNDLEKKDINI